MLVAIQLSVLGLYLPPVLPTFGGPNPLQTIISLPVQTAVCPSRPLGPLTVLVAVQLFVLGLYLPPVSKKVSPLTEPPQTIIALPVQIAVCADRAEGALTVLVAVQLFVVGLYLPPVFKGLGRHHLRPTRSSYCQSILRYANLVQRVRWPRWWLSNYPCWDCISRRYSKRWHYQIHPKRSFHCRSRLPCDRIGQWARSSC